MFERENHLEAIKSILNAAWKINHIIECNYDLFPEWNSDIMGHIEGAQELIHEWEKENLEKPLYTGKWVYLPVKPCQSCYCVIRMKDKSVKLATFNQYICKDINGNIKDLSFFESLGEGYEDHPIEDGEVECWCGLDKVADLLDGKQ